MENKANKIQTMFSAIAVRYDLLNFIFSLSRDKSWRSFMVSRAKVKPCGLFLDVATGTADVAIKLAKSDSSSIVVGLDFCTDMLQVGRVKLANKTSTERVHLVTGDILKLPFTDNKFDSVTIAFGLRNVTDLNIAFKEMTRVTKPGGRIVTLELTRPVNRFPRYLHRFYLSKIIPPIGRFITGDKFAYAYLPASILKFPPPEEIKRIMLHSGITRVNYYPLTAGAVTVHVGIK
ncbi:MAG: bifunctional demethylmenaquinone methyltransferase/2-methoxy-6-polyprenyl-1,4-benzoquinol methylase UbiE [Chloroflexi bacterium]|nr:bifunctional demethylmenaquinone methyltransferase/2-methoxy-6-polyprenyl-1,4-benzoquinol methylase UbiE [Chloroflexota bacterium]